eukprot:gene15195-biopygen8150
MPAPRPRHARATPAPLSCDPSRDPPPSFQRQPELTETVTCRDSAVTEQDPAK